MAGKAQFPPSVNPGIPKRIAPPPGWTLVPFGEVLDIVERPVGLKDHAEYQLVTAKRSRGGIVPREKLRGKDVLTKSQFRVEEGDFLISRRQIVHGACGIVPESLDGAIVSNEYAVLRPKRDLTLEYLAYYSHTPHFQQTCFHSSVGVAIEKMVFKVDEWLGFPMLLPPLPEQQKIAAILGSVDEAIQATQAVIDQTRKVKQGLFQQLLTRGIGHTRFKKTEIGEIPEAWTVAALGKCFHNLDNMRVPVKASDRKEMRGDIPYYGASGIIDWVHRSLFNECLLLLAEDGANLLTRSLPIAFRIEGPSFVNNHAHVYRPSEALEIDLAVEILCQMDLTPYVTGSAQPKLNKAQSDSILMPIPPLSEQKEIVSVFASMNQTIIESTTAHDHLLEMKRGLMQDLLTGRVRVKGVA